MADPENVHVLGITDAQLRLPDLGLAVWGRPHLDYGDMTPLHDPPTRLGRSQVAMAHGHYVAHRPPAEERFRPSWLIGDDEIAATGADYVALGHWNRAARVGAPHAPAYYSGSPDSAGTVNLVVLEDGERAKVSRLPLITRGSAR